MTSKALPHSLPHPEIGQRSRNSGLINILVCGTLFLIGYIFSSWLLEIYAGGDQQHYRRFWTAMTWARPSQWQDLQTRYLGSNDYLYSAIISFGANSGVDRIAYLSAWNALLISATIYLCLKHKASILFTVLLLTNYYLMVVLFSAERVKFAYLFLALALCVNRPRLRLMLALAAGFCHTQAVIQFASTAIYTISSQYRHLLRIRGRAVFILFVAPLAAAAAGYYILSIAGDVILQKSEFYADESEGILEIFQWALILGAGTIVFRNHVPFFLSMLPLGVLTFLFGNRINIATLALFLTLALAQKKTSHPLVLAVMGYMSFKSIGFISLVIATGQGFVF